MHTPTLTPALRVGRPWPARLASAFGEPFAALAHKLRASQQRWQERRREGRELDAALELSDHTLRDMGAPEWLQSSARARREAQQFERELLRISPRAGDARHP